MTISWHLIVRAALGEPDPNIDRVAQLVAAVPGLSHGLVFWPATTSDPYLDDGRPPVLALQLDFSAIEPLEAALASGGALHALAPLLPAGADIEEQAMLARVFPVPEPTSRDEPACTYLVTYEGTPDDANVWHSYYIAHHPPIMARFPGIRAISIFTPLEWCSAFPARRGTAFQRNKVVFDDAAALHAALNSPVRHEMRADFKHFPTFVGANTHYPMHTRSIALANR